MLYFNALQFYIFYCEADTISFWNVIGLKGRWSVIVEIILLRCLTLDSRNLSFCLFMFSISWHFLFLLIVTSLLKCEDSSFMKSFKPGPRINCVLNCHFYPLLYLHNRTGINLNIYNQYLQVISLHNHTQITYLDFCSNVNGSVA